MTDSYTPNQIPLGKRATNVLSSLVLLGYGGYGIWVNDLYVPSKHGKGSHLHDFPAWVMFGAFICGCLVMLSVVVDHYDKRNNEIDYQQFALAFKIIGGVLLALSLVFDVGTRA